MPTIANENGTRVWVKASAVESIRNPRQSFKEKMQRKPVTSLSGHLAQLSLARQGSFTSATGSVASYTSRGDFDDNGSEIGSIGFPFFDVGRTQEWGWKVGYMTENSKGNITVRLDEVNPDSPVPAAPIVLPANSLSNGDIVMANEYPL